MVKYELELRNVPQFRVMEYLVEIGGVPTGERAVQGNGWEASLIEMEPAQIVTITVPRDL